MEIALCTYGQLPLSSYTFITNHLSKHLRKTKTLIHIKSLEKIAVRESLYRLLLVWFFGRIIKLVVLNVFKFSQWGYNGDFAVWVWLVIYDFFPIHL